MSRLRATASHRFNGQRHVQTSFRAARMYITAVQGLEFAMASAGSTSFTYRHGLPNAIFCLFFTGIFLRWAVLDEQLLNHCNTRVFAVFCTGLGGLDWSLGRALELFRENDPQHAGLQTIVDIWLTVNSVHEFKMRQQREWNHHTNTDRW